MTIPRFSARSRRSNQREFYLAFTRRFLHGLTTGSKLKSAFPDLKIIVVTPNDDLEAAKESVNCWASGYLHMKSTSPELIKALRDAMHGVRYLSPVLGKNFEDIRFKDQGFQSSYQLTSRQRDVLRLLGSGCTMKEAGATLGITASLPSLKFLYICSPSG